MDKYYSFNEFFCVIKEKHSNKVIQVFIDDIILLSIIVQNLEIEIFNELQKEIKKNKWVVLKMLKKEDYLIIEIKSMESF